MLPGGSINSSCLYKDTDMNRNSCPSLPRITMFFSSEFLTLSEVLFETSAAIKCTLDAETYWEKIQINAFRQSGLTDPGHAQVQPGLIFSQWGRYGWTMNRPFCFSANLATQAANPGLLWKPKTTTELEFLKKLNHRGASDLLIYWCTREKQTPEKTDFQKNSVLASFCLYWCQQNPLKQNKSNDRRFQKSPIL